MSSSSNVVKLESFCRNKLYTLRNREVNGKISDS